MALNRTVSDPEDVAEDNELDTAPEETPQPDNQTLIRLLDNNEKVRYLLSMIHCLVHIKKYITVSKCLLKESSRQFL